MDEADKANDVAEIELQARLTKRFQVLKPDGHCKNCEDKLLPQQRLFCSIECREDYERRGHK